MGKTNCEKLEAQLAEANAEISRERLAKFRSWDALEDLGRQYYERVDNAK